MGGATKMFRRTTAIFSDGSSDDFKTKTEKDLHLQAKMRYPNLTITSYTVKELLCDYICSLR
jgi:hypothetical protein